MLAITGRTSARQRTSVATPRETIMLNYMAFGRATTAPKTGRDLDIGGHR
jgi:hypothetical protein